jgi:hypothetical protein
MDKIAKQIIQGEMKKAWGSTFALGANRKGSIYCHILSPECRDVFISSSLSLLYNASYTGCFCLHPFLNQQTLAAVPLASIKAN